MFQAVEACRSRNALLTDRPSESESSQFLADPVALAKAVEAEVQALQKGTDPYERRAGDYWRGVPAGAMLIPARVYAPPQVNDDNAEAMPLVIALHGAGGDENAFMDGYGAGAIKRLADRHGFVVVAPSTYWVMLNPSSLDALVDSMAADYPIDRARVYLIGHSLGAIATEPILRRQARDVAGAVLIAGGKAARGDDGKACPTLLVAGELDPVAPPHQVAGAAERAKASGLPVEFLLVRDAGHIFVAGDALPQAVEWLLPKRGQAKRE
jgi:poly(3-hydroxybutyrate) depolymerase